MEIKIIAWILATVLSALAYRAGGMGQESTARPKWIPKFMRRSWVRDWPIAVISLLTLLLWWQPATLLGWAMLICSIGLTGGAISTYWDDLFGKTNYWFHGFIIGLAVFLLSFCGITWGAIILRAFMMAILIGGWCAIFSIDYVEEFGRGFFITATIPLLLI